VDRGNPPLLSSIGASFSLPYNGRFPDQRR
jgi:hypothetical protein